MVGRSESIVAVLIAVSLAGCAGDEGTEPVVDFENLERTELQEGKGAIAGVLFDDRFRPIELKDEGEATTEFQAEGFILLQETGARVLTNENGEFVVLDLDPGTYTLRVTAAGHEAKPQKVRVEEGLFAETSVTARRTVIEAGAVVVEEYMMFVPCTVGYFIQSFIYNCATDLSFENARYAVPRDYTGESNATYLIGEVKAKDEDRYTFQIRDTAGSIRWGVDTFDGTYSKIILEKGVKNIEHNDQERNIPWNNTETTEFLLFPGAPREKEISDATAGGCNQAIDDQLNTIDDVVPEEELTLGFAPIPRTCQGYQGIGVGLAYEARLIMSLMIGEPQVSVEDYCVICE